MPLSLNFLEILLGLSGFVGRPYIQPHLSLYSLQKFYCIVVGRIYKNISSLIPCDLEGLGFSNSEWLEFVDLHCFLSFHLVNCSTELISFLEHFSKCGPYHLELFQFTFPPWTVSLIRHTACLPIIVDNSFTKYWPNHNMNWYSWKLVSIFPGSNVSFLINCHPKWRQCHRYQVFICKCPTPGTDF